MKWIEIVELRSAGSTRRQLEPHLQELIDQLEKREENQKVRLYYRLGIDTDISIHLFNNSSEAKKRGSPLGARLSSVLKAYGLVNHTIWIENRKD